MGRLKEHLYNSFVRKNGRVWYEYERYVKEHMEEHRLHRLRHLRVLFKLNWFYRVKKQTTPYLYWDVPVEPIEIKMLPDNKKKELSKNNSGSEKKPTERRPEKSNSLDVAKKANIAQPSIIIRNNIQIYSESSESRRDDEYRLMKKLIGYDVISFDIFDTILLRPFSEPSSLFILLQKLNNIINFERIRADAAKKVYERNKANGIKEITIREIYDEIENKTGIPCELGIEREEKCEYDLCFANGYIKRVIELLIEQGKTIVLTSDMYLSQEFIEKLLKKNNIKGFERIYLSSSYGYGKKEGLFKQLKNDYAGKTIIHVGDDKVKDFESPKEEQIEAYLYRNVNWIGKEKRTNDISKLIGSAYKGIVNSHLLCGDKKYTLQYEYGFVNGGIYIFGFVNWIKQMVEEKGIDKVLFVARDGYILNKVYQEILKKNNSEYVFWSRVAGLRITAKYDKYTFIKTTIEERNKDENPITIQKWLEITHLQVLAKKIRKYKLKESYLIQNSMIEKLKRFVNENWESILSVYKDEVEAAKAYFQRQIGNSKSILLVDVGWQGQSILSLKEIMLKEWHFDCSVECALVASYPTDESANETYLIDNAFKTYAFAINYNRDIYQYYKKNNNKVIKSWFEFFTQAPCPTFEGFEKDGKGCIKYKFGYPEVENYETIRQIQMGIYDYCKIYAHAFQEYPFMYNISGADALRPFMQIFQNKEYMQEVFKDCIFPLGTFSGSTGFTASKVDKYL